MAYISNQDLIDRVGSTRAAELTTDSGSTPDADKVTEARLGAEGEVNGYLARRYAVPINLTAHPDLAAALKSITLDVAAYRLHTLRQPVPEEVSSVRKMAIEWCSKVSRGEIVLPAAATPASATADSPTVSWGGKARTDPGIREDL